MTYEAKLHREQRNILKVIFSSDVVHIMCDLYSPMFLVSLPDGEVQTFFEKTSRYLNLRNEAESIYTFIFESIISFDLM